MHLTQIFSAQPKKKGLTIPKGAQGLSNWSICLPLKEFPIPDHPSWGNSVNIWQVRDLSAPLRPTPPQSLPLHFFCYIIYWPILMPNQPDPRKQAVSCSSQILSAEGTKKMKPGRSLILKFFKIIMKVRFC